MEKGKIKEGESIFIIHKEEMTPVDTQRKNNPDHKTLII